MTSRRDPRPWLALWCVLMLGVSYIAGWAFWAYSHQNLGLVQLPPGAPGETESGSSFRVTSMVHTPEPEGSSGDRADPGMTFVLVGYEVTRADPEENCGFKLAGAWGRSYDTSTSVSGRPLNAYCSDLPLGEVGQGELIFEVPLAQVDQLAGIYDFKTRDWRSRYQVLTPPR